MSIKKLYFNMKKLLLISALSFGLYANDLEIANAEDNFKIETDDQSDEELNQMTNSSISNNITGLINFEINYEYRTKTEEDILNYSDLNITSNPDPIANNMLVDIEDLTMDQETSLEVLREENQEKIIAICEKYNLTLDQFNEFACICMKEAKQYSGLAEDYDSVYIDAYAVTNTFYNRINSIKWRYDISAKNYEGAGENLYGQITAKRQSAVYINGYHKSLLDVDKTGHPAYQAVIDMLYSEVTMHNYLNFKSNNYDPEGKEQFVTGGNRYHGELKPEDVYIPEESKVLSLTQNY